MRKITALFLAVMALTLLAACNAQKEPENPWKDSAESLREITENEGVQLTLDGDTLTPTGGTFYMVNKSDEVVYFGWDFEIEAEFGGKWYNIMVEDAAFFAEELGVRPGGKYTLETDWHNYVTVGELPPGNYRMVKQYRLESTDWSSPYYVACEFTIK